MKSAFALVQPDLNSLLGGAIAVTVGNPDEPRVLGLDLSSSAVGWTFKAGDRHLKWGKVVFSESAPYGQRLRDFHAFLTALVQQFSPNRVCVEKPVSRHGSTTTRHNEMLAIVRMVFWQSSRYEIPEHDMIPPQTVKRCLKVPRGNSHAENKALMVQHINERLGLNLHFHPKSKKLSDDDTADSMAVVEAIGVLDHERATGTGPRRPKKKGKKMRSADTEGGIVPSKRVGRNEKTKGGV